MECTGLFVPTENLAPRRSWSAATSSCAVTTRLRRGHQKVKPQRLEIYYYSLPSPFTLLCHISQLGLVKWQSVRCLLLHVHEGEQILNARVCRNGRGLS